MRVLANDGIDAAGKQILEAAGFEVITQKIAEARQYLVEGASFLIELKNALKYKE